ncbi:MAG TPA: rhomboid family intramembrane serine protease [Methylomirabilota bacterium]|nr:rhomboid family intramembrane serine protease [Methylomirabilota bacterium]
MTDQDIQPGREPLFNMPATVTGLIGALLVVHFVRVFALSPAQDGQVILLFSFIPIRYSELARDFGFPGGVWADIWTPVTYGLLHGSATHLLFNVVWLAAFGSALARRFGAARFMAFTVLATMAGAGAHYLAHSDDMVPVVGASAAISGHMAAVARFMFQAGGPLRTTRRDPAIWQAEAVSLTGIFADRRVLGFLGVWFGLNLLFGLGAAPVMGEDVSIAWEAHVGGFVFGLLAFSLFDPPADERYRRALREMQRAESIRRPD